MTRGPVITQNTTLARDLLALRLVDELRLFVHPVVVGAGRGRFDDRHEVRDLRLAESRSFAGGVVLLRYLRNSAANPAPGPRA